MKTTVIVSLLFFLSLTGCKKDALPEEKEYPFIILTKISRINTEGATFHANITSLGKQDILEYGFVWDNINSKPLVTDYLKFSGKKPSVGLFNQRIKSGLEAEGECFVRAFIKTNKTIVYSNAKSFFSKGCLPPQIEEFYPDSVSAGGIITIIGKNFNSNNSRNLVLFDSIAGIVVKSTPDTILVQCPNSEESFYTNISLEIAKQKTESANEIKVINPWRIIGNLADDKIWFDRSFVIENKGYSLLTIKDSEQDTLNEFWAIDPETLIWEKQNPFPATKRKWATSFIIDNKGFLGLGIATEDYERLFDIWQYNPENDNWLQMADYPGKVNERGFKYPHFVIDNKLYIYSYNEGSELWKYNYNLNTWQELPVDKKLQDSRIMDGFTINNKGYFIEDIMFVDRWGRSGSHGLIIWEYNPLDHSVDRIDSIKTNSSYLDIRNFNLGSKLFINAGNNIIEYDLKTKYVFYHQVPSSFFLGLGLNIIFDNKALLNSGLSDEVYEFYPR